MLCSLEDGTLWTESCPRLRATIATALNLLRVPVFGLLAFCRFSRSSVLRLTPPRWSVHTNETCILAFGRLSQFRYSWSKLYSLLAKSGRANSQRWKVCGSSTEREIVQSVAGNYSGISLTHSVPPLEITAQSLKWLTSSQCSLKKGGRRVGWRIRRKQNPLKGNPNTSKTSQHLCLRWFEKQMCNHCGLKTHKTQVEHEATN